ncbi:MAG: hypothetical protein P4L73_13330 [Caulobacteraceae bacterium]|nr:hypothetical protein [Caulobacteraceae bacterium]
MADFIQTAEADIAKWFGEGVALVEDGAVMAWKFVHPFITALEPSAWAAALPIIIQAITDIASGDIADIETAVLNKAEALGLSLFDTLKGDVLQAIIAAVKAFHPATTTTAS